MKEGRWREFHTSTSIHLLVRFSAASQSRRTRSFGVKARWWTLGLSAAPAPALPRSIIAVKSLEPQTCPETMSSTHSYGMENLWTWARLAELSAWPIG